MKRLTVFAVTTVVLCAVAVGYTVREAHRAGQAAPPSGRLDLTQPGQIIFRDASGFVASVPVKGKDRMVSGLACERFHAAAGSGVCLAPRLGALGFSAMLVDRHLNETRRMNPPGIPNRARLAADGRFAAWTAFVTGHSYANTGFSTRTSILDLGNDRLYADIETLQVFHDGRRLGGADLNLWGVTFTPDGKSFYATVSTGGHTHLVVAEVASWEARTLRENAECPSLSPDGRRIAFKKRIASGGLRPWRLAVLDLATMTETELPGTDGIDDQAVWLDDRTLIYGMSRDGNASDIWATSADGVSLPHLLIPDAASPSVL